MEKAIRSHLNLQKAGGGAALYLAAAYLAAIPYFLLVVDYRSAADPAAKLAMAVGNQGSLYAITLVTYVIFGLALTVLAIALGDRLRGTESPLARVCTGLGLTWACLLIASGSVFTMGMKNVIALQAADPAGAASAWWIIESIADGLGGGSGEVVGGPWVLLVSWASLRSKRLPVALNWLGLATGLVGMVSIIPPLHDAAVGFGVLQIPWLVWLGIALLRTKESTKVA
jgi:hypothetical protein